MDSDDSYHSESEFYYPDEFEDGKNKENTRVSELQKEQDDFTLADAQDFILGQRTENTVKKTQYDLNVWRRYFRSIGEEREIEDIPSSELNVLICRFFMEINKKDGGAYEPSSLTSFQRSLQRYLNDKNSKMNIMKDQEFSKSREVLLSKKRQLVEVYAKGNRPQVARQVSEEEEDLLFCSGEFGEGTPEALQRTVWWLLSLHFGFRARDESRKLKWGDIILETDTETGNELLAWTAERGSKTRHGDGQSRAFNPTAQATNVEHCPVCYYKKFRSHRPEAMNQPEAPFYLAINHRRKKNDNIWYTRGLLGKNEIGRMLKIAASRAGLHGNVTNHSVRKTSISRLMDADVPVNYVAQLSGHKNLKSLDSYKTASISHQRKMSLVLSRTSQQQSMRSSSTSTVSTTEENKALSLTAQPVVPSTSQPLPLGIFSGASIGKIEGCSFTFHVGGAQKVGSPPKPKKKRRVIISDDSDSD